MSGISGNISCPLCKKEQSVFCTTEAEPHGFYHGNYYLECRTGEQWFTCGHPACGHSYWYDIINIDGKLFWKEERWFPMDNSGKVLCPKVSSDDSDD